MQRDVIELQKID